jgi:hypothetical protein
MWRVADTSLTGRQQFEDVAEKSDSITSAAKAFTDLTGFYRSIGSAARPEFLRQRLKPN